MAETDVINNVSIFLNFKYYIEYNMPILLNENIFQFFDVPCLSSLI